MLHRSINFFSWFVRAMTGAPQGIGGAYLIFACLNAVRMGSGYPSFTDEFPLIKSHLAFCFHAFFEINFLLK